MHLPFRCTDMKQFEEYERLIVELYNANSGDIFRITGCLSKCDKFVYSAKPVTDIRIEDPKISYTPWDNNTFKVVFYFPTGEYELKEQVRCYVSVKCLFKQFQIIPVHNIHFQ